MNVSTGNRGTVLVIDDDPAVLVIVRNILVAGDYRVLLAAESADAIHLTQQKHIRIDLALINVRMSGVRGTELAEEILSIRPGTRLLWMSGFVDDGFIRVKLIAQKAGFISKVPLNLGLQRAVDLALTADDAAWNVGALRTSRSLTAGV